MGEVPPTPRELYAEELYRRSLRIIGAVHDEDPATAQRYVDEALAQPAPDGVDPAVALAIVMAAQVDPETTAAQRLGWIDGKLRRLTRVPAHADSTEVLLGARLTEILDRLQPSTDLAELDDPDLDARVRAVVDGDASVIDLPRMHRLIAVGLLLRRNLTIEQMAQQLGCSKALVGRLKKQLREVLDTAARAHAAEPSDDAGTAGAA